MTLAEFKQKKKPKKQSVFEKYKDEIFELVQHNYTQESICEFLVTKKDVDKKPTQQNLSKWLKSFETSKTEIKKQFKKEPIRTLEKETSVASTTTKKSIFNIPKNVGIDTEIKDASKEHPELFD